jgi:hypothetical protein
VSVWCPLGSSQPQPVSQGSYSAPEAAPAARRTSQVACPVGYSCSGGQRSACVAGSFANTTGATACAKCPSGRFGSTQGLNSSLCTAVCPAGKWCSLGTVTPLSCGSVSVFCPEGSQQPHPVSVGSYSAPESAPDSQRNAQLPCPIGYSCSGAVRSLCAAGSFQNATGAAACVKCPPGRFGSTSGLNSSLCTAPCPAGKWCSLGTVTPLDCGSVAVFCPAQSQQPQPVPVGSYSTPELAAASQRTGHLACEVGYSCSGAVRTPCPSGSFSNTTGATACTKCAAGRFGSTAGLDSELCTASCPAGHWCPVGTVTPLSCGSVSVFCPPGSNQPRAVSAGHYSAPLAAASDQRSSELPCPVGFSCAGGVRTLCAQGSFANRTLSLACRLCAAGRFGGSVGLNTSACSGRSFDALSVSSSDRLRLPGRFMRCR